MGIVSSHLLYYVWKNYQCMRCLGCGRTFKSVSSKTRETQKCGMCRGVRNQSLNRNGRLTT